MSKTPVPEWSEIGDQAVAEQLLDLVRGFHDSIAVEARWEGAEDIDRKGSLALAGWGILTLFLKSQFQDVPQVEAKFVGVSRFSYEYELDASGVLTVGQSGISARFGSWDIHAQSLMYRVISHDSPWLADPES